LNPTSNNVTVLHLKLSLNTWAICNTTHRIPQRKQQTAGYKKWPYLT